MNEHLREKLNKLRDNVFVNDESLDYIENEISSGNISEEQGLIEIKKLEPLVSGKTAPFELITNKQIEDEWNSLVSVIVQAEAKAQKRSSSQFIIGLVALPLTVVLIFSSFFLKWHHSPNSTTIAAIIAGCLTAISAHSFYILRIHQQASLAAERFSEKRVGLLFLRIAAKNKNPESAASLLDAGTKMFLGHHAPNAIPLEANDRSISKKK